MEATLAKPNWGLKRTCLSCSERFYDLKRDPIVCPNCGTVFDPLALVRPRRARAVASSQAKAKAEAKIDSVAEKNILPEEDDVTTDADLGVDPDEIDLGEDEDDLIPDTDEIDSDPDVSEAMENAKENTKET